MATAIYGIESISPESAYDIGVLFFNVFGLDVTTAGYYKYKGNEDDVEFVEIPLLQLRDEIKINDATSFRLYFNERVGGHWDASFGYSTNNFGGFYHFDAQCAFFKKTKIKYVEFIRRLCSKFPFSYGIVYQVDGVVDGFYYAEGGNFVQIYRCENPVLFEMETGGVYEGQERYNNTMLRMVYPVNIINECHLGIIINGISLKEWVLSNDKHGRLEKLDNEMWLWEVQEDDLDEVNALLGEAGILISWKPSSMEKKLRKLP